MQQQRERIPVTREGLEALQVEYDHLVNHRRPEITRVLAAAREEGDLRENAGYDAAKHDQGFIEGRIRELEEILRRVQVIDAVEQDVTAVRVGSTVTVEIDGTEETYTIVGAVEARPSAGRISNQSPFGRALVGHRVGDEVDIQTPATTLRARVLRIER
ncbi:MAG TPA: transcription elongation factor GreA [Thermomicrobiaceae bacterium]|nr:transcription elongation factor GreA [Thermomicrobiaceae bacterium]